MSNQINDGGPAFPLGPTAGTMKPMQDGTLIVTHYGMEPGVTIRDYFAAAALQGLLSIMAKDYDAFFANKLAHACYETADAMLKAREAKP